MLTTIIILTTILFLLIASYYDLKTGEIPDRVSIGLVAVILILSIYRALFESYTFLINAILIGAAYFIIGYISYHFGQLGGGDIKLLAGIGGAVANIQVDGLLPNYIAYVIDTGIVVIPYMTVYGLVLGFRNKSVFSEFAMEIRTVKVILLIAVSFIPLLLLLLLQPENIRRILIIILGLLPIFVLLAVYLKTIEKIVMQKTIDVSELKEEDILANDVLVDGEKIAEKHDMVGLTKEQIEKIRESAKEGRISDKITIKWGVKFVPVLFLGFLIFAVYGNALELFFLRYLY